MKITAPYRGRASTKRLDLTDLRHLLSKGDGQRMFVELALVVAPDDGGAHFEVLADDVHVEVVLQPSLTPLTCRLAASMWRIPDIGEEVLVVIPGGAIEFSPTIIDVMSSGTVPATQGPALGTAVITRPSVLIHDGQGGAVALAVLSSLQATVNKLNDLITAYNGHTHLDPVSGSTGIASTLISGAAAAAVGTDVLKGK